MNARSVLSRYLLVALGSALPACGVGEPAASAPEPTPATSAIPPAPPPEPTPPAEPAPLPEPDAQTARVADGPFAELWLALQRGRPTRGLIARAARLPLSDAEQLREALASGQPAHRLAAVELAAWVPAALRNAVLDALLDLLAQDADLEVRAAVAGHFARQPSERAQPALVTALRGDASPRVRAAAAEALGRLPEPDGRDAPTDAGRALRRALQEDDVAVASAAVVALRRRGDFGAVDALRRARKDAKHPAVRLNASEALSVLTGRRDGLPAPPPADAATAP